MMYRLLLLTDELKLQSLKKKVAVGQP